MITLTQAAMLSAFVAALAIGLAIHCWWIKERQERQRLARHRVLAHLTQIAKRNEE